MGSKRWQNVDSWANYSLKNWHVSIVTCILAMPTLHLISR